MLGNLSLSILGSQRLVMLAGGNSSSGFEMEAAKSGGSIGEACSTLVLRAMLEGGDDST